MANHSRNPSLYQINTRVALAGLAPALGRTATLDDFPDSALDRLASLGFDWVWFLGIWQTGPIGRQISLNNPEWLHEYRKLLPDFQDSDVCGSCFAVQGYTVHLDFGGDAALARLRSRVHARGMKLLLDFVPNHTAPDHPWVKQYPEFYVAGSEERLAQEPQNYTRVNTPLGPAVLAYGRDPYFSGWPDTLQLNYAEPKLQEAMASELEHIATRCDGVRCDMAMLILPGVFERTWGMRPEPFWPRAIERTRKATPGFVFMAEVYWDLEWELQQQGFNYTYDKRLYDRLVEGHARPVRDHLRAGMDFQQRSARFLENHDEPRAAGTFDPAKHKAAAIVTFLCPGLRFIHQGQMEGWKKRIPVHLGRGPAEPTDREIQSFYERLLACVHHKASRDGQWTLLETNPAWDGNWTSDCFICSAWQGSGGERLLIAVNFAANQSQCYVKLPFTSLEGMEVRLADMMGPEVHDRRGDDLISGGLYLDLPPWGFNVFEIRV